MYIIHIEAFLSTWAIMVSVAKTRLNVKGECSSR
jgi:hypothetical protein